MPSEEELRTIIDTLPALVWQATADGELDFLNERWCEYTGLTLEAARGWGWGRTVHPEDLAGLEACWRGLLARGEAGEHEARMRRRDGVYRWFLLRVAPLRGRDGEVRKWYGTHTDIEDRKRAEAKLRSDEQELREIINAIPQAIVVMGTDGRAQYGNQMAMEYTGMGAEEFALVGERERFTHPEDAEATRERRLAGVARGEAFQMEQRIPGRDGVSRWFLVDYKPLRDGEGRILRWYATATDIEHRKRAEERVRNENITLREELDRSLLFEDIVGSSPALRRVLAQVAKVAPNEATVLITGETGTGKELMARAIHRRSPRAARPFVRVNCAAIPGALLASELFGHERGAFTGAVQRRIGRFEAAEGGTIFLDEVGELPPEAQIALLRVLQEREIERVGSSWTIPVDVRVVAATHRDLRAAMAAGAFREDLYYRLNVVPIAVPPLRERSEDIPLLVEYLIDRYARKAGKRITEIPARTMALFAGYGWPGNVRELQNVIERAVVLCDGPVFTIEEAWIGSEGRAGGRAEAGLAGAVEALEREMIEAALTACEGRVHGPRGAAERLRIPRQTLESKIDQLGIDKYRFKGRG